MRTALLVDCKEWDVAESAVGMIVAYTSSYDKRTRIRVLTTCIVFCYHWWNCDRLLLIVLSHKFLCLEIIIGSIMAFQILEIFRDAKTLGTWISLFLSL